MFLMISLKINNVEKNEEILDFFSEKNSNGRGAQGDLLQHNWEARSDISRICFDRFTPLLTLERFFPQSFPLLAVMFI